MLRIVTPDGYEIEGERLEEVVALLRETQKHTNLEIFIIEDEEDGGEYDIHV